MQVKSTVVWAQHSGDLRDAIQDGKRIIVTTVEKFPYIISEIGQGHKDNKFAIIIDEAHSGQSGRNSANMNLALSGLATDDEADNEDKINALMEGRKLVTSASYFAFTATPKNKTEETFGVPYEEDGEIKHRPFHVYTMKQAIQEGFILDVLKNYTTIDSWYRIKKTVEDDPMFDKKRAQKKLRSFVEGKSEVIAKKAEMMVDHFHEQVIAKKKLNGQARAMVVTASIPRCVEYYYAINKCLEKRHSSYKTTKAPYLILDDIENGAVVARDINLVASENVKEAIITLDGSVVTVDTSVLTEPGLYTVSLTDMAGNSTQYMFRRRYSLNISAVGVFAWAGAIILGLVIYGMHIRKHMRVR